MGRPALGGDRARRVAHMDGAKVSARTWLVLAAVSWLALRIRRNVTTGTRGRSRAGMVAPTILRPGQTVTLGKPDRVLFARTRQALALALRADVRWPMTAPLAGAMVLLSVQVGVLALVRRVLGHLVLPWPALAVVLAPTSGAVMGQRTSARRARARGCQVRANRTRSGLPRVTVWPGRRIVGAAAMDLDRPLRASDLVRFHQTLIPTRAARIAQWRSVTASLLHRVA